MRVAIAARGALIQAIRAAAGGGGIRFQAHASKEFRRLAYMIQPDVLILDEMASEHWRTLSSVPRIRAKCRTRVIALMEGITKERKRMAIMAGCFDGIDLNDSFWPEELAASLEIARRRVACDLAARRARDVHPQPQTSIRRPRPARAQTDPPVLRVVRG